MKKIIYSVLAFALVFTISCKKSSLDLENPNEPGIPALQSEEGVKRAALGVYSKFGLEYWWFTLQYHDIMGDTYFASVGNFSWRWANQPTKIITSSGQTLLPPQGGSQGTELRNRNSRAQGDNNAFQFEWLSMYLVNNQANLVLASAEDPELALSGDENMKKAVLKAWGHWWKGFAYSRIGSMYISGIIANTLNETNNDFIAHPEMRAEANRQFDLAIAALNGISPSADYNEFLGDMIPSFTQKGKGGVLAPQEWIRNMNTYKARNILVGKEVNDITPAEWASIITLTNDGIKAGDKIFTMRSALENDLVQVTAWNPYRTTLSLWSELSERLVQDVKPNDARFVRNFRLAASPVINAQTRGFNYSTRYKLKWIEDGGDYSSQEPGLAEIPIACSYEENALMQAEALIRTGNIEGGLAFVDAVRTSQNASLPATVGTSLNATQAYAELRSERRIGLLNKNVSFYDARRWGVIKPLAEGGGRTGAVVLYIPTGATTYVVDNNATIDYNYLSWWDVPENELDFNSPSVASAPVKVQ